MIENKDDELPRQSSAQRAFKFTSNGFIQQVMQKLPWRLVNLNRIWMVSYYFLGVVFLFVSNVLNQLCMVFSNSMGGINGWITSVGLSIQTPIIVYLTVLTFTFLGIYQAMESNR